MEEKINLIMGKISFVAKGGGHGIKLNDEDKWYNPNGIIQIKNFWRKLCLRYPEEWLK